MVGKARESCRGPQGHLQMDKQSQSALNLQCGPLKCTNKTAMVLVCVKVLLFDVYICAIVTTSIQIYACPQSLRKSLKIKLSACTSTSPSVLLNACVYCLIPRFFFIDTQLWWAKEKNLVQFTTFMCIIPQHSRKIAYICVIYMPYFLEQMLPSNESCHCLLKEGMTYFHVQMYQFIGYVTCQYLGALTQNWDVFDNEWHDFCAHFHILCQVLQ